MNYLDLLPAEILHEIAQDSEPAYYALITAYPRFAREVTPGRRVDYRLGFGHDVSIRPYRSEWGAYRQDNPIISMGIVWKRHGLTHRIDGPAAVDYFCGSHPRNRIEHWYRNGKPHREDGPALIVYRHSGTIDKQEWYRNGKLHRDGAPALVKYIGTKRWYREDRLHREDGPAVIKDDLTEYWYREGVLHREDGPAVIKCIGSEYWYHGGGLHREDGPAVMKHNGTKKWYIRNRLHRDDGPAVIIHNADGSYKEEWYRDGIMQYARG